MNNKAKNIYWNYKEESADIKWIDYNTVMINRFAKRTKG
ncbi:DUF5412 family protein [Sporosarcina sp. Te-1]|nr:DUF5412 family protein [Sporosarcina sp. Te-1]